MKRLAYVAVGVLSFGLAFGATAAFGDAVQDGYNNQHGLTLADLNIDYRSAHPAAGQCVLYGETWTDFTVPGQRQVEAGQLACASGSSIDGTCFNGHFFAERYDGTPGGYHCTEGGAFSAWTDYDTVIQRQGTTGAASAGDGITTYQGGYATSDVTRNIVWAETSDFTDTCPNTGGSANFNSWEYIGADGAWHVTSTASLWPGGTTPYFGPCYSLSTLSASGAFNATN